MSDDRPKEKLVPGDPVTYWYGARKVHAEVHRLSKTGQRVRIKFQRPGYKFLDHIYVKPENLERGHV
jgi:hypothetical protein